MDNDLTRSEAAKYLGFRSVEGIRHLQKTGKLRATRDKNGHFRFAVAELDQVKMSREDEGLHPRLTKRELDMQRETDQINARYDKIQADLDAEDRARTENRKKYNHAIEAFKSSHFDEYEARAALGDLSSYHFRELVRQGMLRKVQPPERPRGLGLIDIGFGPFYDRQEVLTVRREMIEATAQLPVPSPTALKKHGIDGVGGLIASLLEVFLDEHGK
jgi:hypothetical protein